ncbi:hypothetical protein JCM18903_1802 [Psychrobacter sp. JCM 18903]|nr:hypothetical protein JCM18903_1802 [Psychrobacter sp. JCM 18903]
MSEGVSWGELCDFNEGLASAQKDGKYGFIDKQANIIVPFSYNFTAEFSEGLAIVKKMNIMDTSTKKTKSLFR